MKFGISVSEIGNFLAGTDLRLPMAALATYFTYADEKLQEQAESSLTPRSEKGEAVMARLVQITAQLANVCCDDPTGWLQSAEEEAEEARRLKSLQRLE